MTFVVTSEYELSQVAPPNLPTATQQYDPKYQEQFNNVLRLYFNQLNKIVGQLQTNETSDGSSLRLPFGAFQDNTTQTQTSINTAKAVTFDTTDASNGVSRGTPTSRIVVANSGWYNFQFSAQLDKASGAAANIWIWPKINGVNVVDSASKIAIQGTTAETIAAWNWVLEMNSNDYFELYWLTDDVDVQLKHELGFGSAPNDVPEIPSVILTATFVSALY